MSDSMRNEMFFNEVMEQNYVMFWATPQDCVCLGTLDSLRNQQLEREATLNLIKHLLKKT